MFDAIEEVVLENGDRTGQVSSGSRGAYVARWANLSTGTLRTVSWQAVIEADLDVYAQSRPRRSGLRLNSVPEESEGDDHSSDVPTDASSALKGSNLPVDAASSCSVPHSQLESSESPAAESSYAGSGCVSENQHGRARLEDSRPPALMHCGTQSGVESDRQQSAVEGRHPDWLLNDLPCVSGVEDRQASGQAVYVPPLDLALDFLALEHLPACAKSENCQPSLVGLPCGDLRPARALRYGSAVSLGSGIGSVDGSTVSWEEVEDDEDPLPLRSAAGPPRRRCAGGVAQATLDQFSSAVSLDVSSDTAGERTLELSLDSAASTGGGGNGRTGAELVAMLGGQHSPTLDNLTHQCPEELQRPSEWKTIHHRLQDRLSRVGSVAGSHASFAGTPSIVSGTCELITQERKRTVPVRPPTPESYAQLTSAETFKARLSEIRGPNPLQSASSSVPRPEIAVSAHVPSNFFPPQGLPPPPDFDPPTGPAVRLACGPPSISHSL